MVAWCEISSDIMSSCLVMGKRQGKGSELRMDHSISSWTLHAKLRFLITETFRCKKKTKQKTKCRPGRGYKRWYCYSVKFIPC